MENIEAQESWFDSNENGLIHLSWLKLYLIAQRVFVFPIAFNYFHMKTPSSCGVSRASHGGQSTFNGGGNVSGGLLSTFNELE